MDQASALTEADERPAVDNEDEPQEPSVTLETALAQLATIPAPALLAILRVSEFASVSMSAFVGFRINPTSYNNPLVRRRLAQEMMHNSLFAERVRESAEGMEEKTVPTPTAAKRPEAAPPSANRENELRAERNRRRQERDEARRALQQAEHEQKQLDHAVSQLEREIEEQKRLAAQQQHRVIRLERQVAQLQAEKTALLKKIRPEKTRTPASRPTPVPPSSQPLPVQNDAWVEAVQHLLDKEKADTALTLATDVLRAAPDDVSALEIAARAYEQRASPQQAATMLRHLLEIRMTHSHTRQAAETLVRVILLQKSPENASKDVKRWLAFLRRHDQAIVAESRPALEHLRAHSSGACTWLQRTVSENAPSLSETLFPPAGALSQDDPLPLRQHWTARRLVQAVDANEEALVTAAREEISHMDIAAAARVWEALERASEEDDSALTPLRRSPRGPVVVDASNVAWHDQNSYSEPRARLRQILGIRRTLRRRGYFPVVLLGDAPLPYTIDDSRRLGDMLDRHEIELVDSGTDADEALLREAKRLQSPVVTNDYMTDWDPDGAVTKIQYTVSTTGEAHLLEQR